MVDRVNMTIAVHGHRFNFSAPLAADTHAVVAMWGSIFDSLEKQQKAALDAEALTWQTQPSYLSDVVQSAAAALNIPPLGFLLTAETKRLSDPRYVEITLQQRGTIEHAFASPAEDAETLQPAAAETAGKRQAFFLATDLRS